MLLSYSLCITIISLLIVEISSSNHGNEYPQYGPKLPKNPGNLGKFMLVKTPDHRANSDFLLVEKSGGKKSLIKLDEKIGNDDRIKMPMGTKNKKQVSLKDNIILEL